MIRLAIIFCITLLCSPFAHPAATAENREAFTVTVEDISNRAYFDAVIKEINNAKDSIYVAMYSMYVRASEINNPAYKLINALIAAQKRGVAVQVYLDSTKGNNKSNMPAYELLKGAGVPVYFIDSKIKLHAKVILIDEAVVITGSSNWTQKAVEENFEHNVILRGSEFAKSELDFFTQLDAVKTTDINKKELPGVRVSARFIQDERFFPSMLDVKDRAALKLYLKFLRDYKGQEWMTADYGLCARYVGIVVGSKNRNYRTDVREILKRLKGSYQLVDYRAAGLNRFQVKLLDYDDVSKPYAVPQEGYFEIPLTYWEYGLDEQFILGEKLAYFICLYEEARNRPKLYWSLGFEAMAQRYHNERTTLSAWFGALEKMDLIEARRTWVKPGESYEERKANEYRFKPLLSPEERTQLWQKMEKQYGKDKVSLCRELAGGLGKDNDFDAVREMIELVNKYGEKLVRQGLAEIADYRHDNPARNIAYLTAIVKRLEKEQGLLR